jgi:hypothetical protein
MNSSVSVLHQFNKKDVVHFTLYELSSNEFLFDPSLAHQRTITVFFVIFYMTSAWDFSQPHWQPCRHFVRPRSSLRNSEAFQ